MYLIERFSGLEGELLVHPCKPSAGAGRDMIELHAAGNKRGIAGCGSGLSGSRWRARLDVVGHQDSP